MLYTRKEDSGGGADLSVEGGTKRLVWEQLNEAVTLVWSCDLVESF